MIVKSACNSGSRRYATAMGGANHLSIFSIHTRNSAPTNIPFVSQSRWNNFIDILDFPKHKPISRMIRHMLFGPLEDRAVPYVGMLAGGVLPGPGNHAPGHLIGGQVGGAISGRAESVG